MDERYKAFYQTYYEGWAQPEVYQESPDFALVQEWYPQIAETVRDVVEGTDGEAIGGYRLREDAKALLVVNFGELVLTPLVVAGRVEIGQLAEDVRADIGLLARGAAEHMPSYETEISAHMIIDSLSRNWSRLRISRYRLWEE
jgi:hypothetical protein